MLVKIRVCRLAIRYAEWRYRTLSDKADKARFALSRANYSYSAEFDRQWKKRGY